VSEILEGIVIGIAVVIWMQLLVDIAFPEIK